MAPREFLSIIRKSGNRFSEKMMLTMTSTPASTHTPAAVAGFATQAARVNERQT